MPPKESLYPADWLRIAEKDLGREYSKFLGMRFFRVKGFPQFT